MPGRLLTRLEVAQQLRVPVKTLKQWAWRRTGPRRIRVGKHVRYRQADVDAWLEKQTIQ